MSIDDVVTGVLRGSGLLEALAAVEHERWSHWQMYLHSQGAANSDGSLTLPADLVDRWTRQAASKYSELSEAEKSSDRDQVRRYLPVIEAELRAKLMESRDEC